MLCLYRPLWALSRVAKNRLTHALHGNGQGRGRWAGVKAAKSAASDGKPSGKAPGSGDPLRARNLRWQQGSHPSTRAPLWCNTFLTREFDAKEMISVKGCVEVLWKGQKLLPEKWEDLQRRTRLICPPSSTTQKLAEWFEKGLVNLSTEVHVKLS